MGFYSNYDYDDDIISSSSSWVVTKFVCITTNTNIELKKTFLVFCFTSWKIKNGGGGDGYGGTWSKLLRFPCKQKQQQEKNMQPSFFFIYSIKRINKEIKLY